MRPEDRYDSLLRYYAAQHGVPWRLLKRQMVAESSANPAAVSPAGARGLMQFMPATWREWHQARGLPSLDDPHNPEAAIAAGARHMAFLYERFHEIPDAHERWRFALAAYNAGRGNVNRALALAREACGQPASFADWVKEGRPPGEWQTWRFASRFLPQVTGKHAAETLAYVRRIAGDEGDPYGVFEDS